MIIKSIHNGHGLSRRRLGLCPLDFVLQSPSPTPMAASPAFVANLSAALVAGAPAEALSAALTAEPVASVLGALDPSTVVSLLRHACDDAAIAAWLTRGADAFLARYREVAPQARGPVTAT